MRVFLFIGTCLLAGRAIRSGLQQGSPWITALGMIAGGALIYVIWFKHEWLDR